MKIINVQQGTEEWFQCRSGIPTASELGNLLTDAGAVRSWATEMPNTYLARKLAEKWEGHALISGGSWATDQGQILEAEAIPAIEWEYGIHLERVGFITTDDGRAGCSPDGVIVRAGVDPTSPLRPETIEAGGEIKCAQPEAHVKYLLARRVPPAYMPQVQGSLWVSTLSYWHFWSYRRRFPLLHVLGEPDPDWQESIGIAVAEFNQRLDAAWARLCELNGGPPARQGEESVDDIRRELGLDDQPQAAQPDPKIPSGSDIPY